MQFGQHEGISSLIGICWNLIAVLGGGWASRVVDNAGCDRSASSDPEKEEEMGGGDRGCRRAS